jgi:hypothetical protein
VAPPWAPTAAAMAPKAPSGATFISGSCDHGEDAIDLRKCLVLLGWCHQRSLDSVANNRDDLVAMKSQCVRYRAVVGATAKQYRPSSSAVARHLRLFGDVQIILALQV